MSVCHKEAKKKATEELVYCEHVKRRVISVVWEILNLYCPGMSILDQTWSLSDPIVCSLVVPKTRGKIPKTMEVFLPAPNEL